MFIPPWLDLADLSRAEGEVVKTSSWILFRAQIFPSLPSFMGRVFTQPIRKCMWFPVSIWMNLRCQKKHETVIRGNITDEILSGNPSQERDAMASVLCLIKTHLWREKSGWAQVRGWLFLLSNLGPPRHTVSLLSGLDLGSSCSNKGSYFGEAVDTWLVLLQISNSCLKC